MSTEDLEQYKSESEMYKRNRDDLLDENKVLGKQLEAAMGALKFYACRNVYKEHARISRMEQVILDRGQFARAAIKEVKRLGKEGQE